MILGKREKGGNLSTLLSQEIGVQEKKKTLSDDYGMQMTTERKESFERMCNLSDLIVEKERRRSEKELTQMVKNLMANLGLTLEQAFDNLGMPEEVRENIMKNM